MMAVDLVLVLGRTSGTASDHNEWWRTTGLSPRITADDRRIVLGELTPEGFYATWDRAGGSDRPLVRHPRIRTLGVSALRQSDRLRSTRQAASDKSGGLTRPSEALRCLTGDPASIEQPCGPGFASTTVLIRLSRPDWTSHPGVAFSARTIRSRPRVDALVLSAAEHGQARVPLPCLENTSTPPSINRQCASRVNPHQQSARGPPLRTERSKGFHRHSWAQWLRQVVRLRCDSATQSRSTQATRRTNISVVQRVRDQPSGPRCTPSHLPRLHAASQ